jgi:hypothetical protein
MNCPEGMLKRITTVTMRRLITRPTASHGLM